MTIIHSKPFARLLPLGMLMSATFAPHAATLPATAAQVIVSAQSTWGTPQDSWAGYTGEVDVWVPSAVSGPWTLSFQSPSLGKEAAAASFWNASATYDASTGTYTLTSPSWSSGVAANSVIKLGFNGTGVLDPTFVLSNCTFNGAPCVASVMTAANAQQTLTTLSQNATASPSGTSGATDTSGTSGTSSGSSSSGGTVQTSASLQLTLSVDSAWAGGFGGNISVQNLSGQTLPAGTSGWKATLKFPDAVTAASVFQSGPWNFTVAIGSDGTVTLTPPSWAASLAPGAVTSSGFNGLNSQGLQSAISTTPNVSLQFASSVPASSGSGTTSGTSGSGTTGGTTGSGSTSTATTTPSTPLPTGAVAGGFLFSPYKDVTNSLNWNTNVASTSVTGTLTPLLQVLPAKVPAVTLAFATGQCGSENWGGVAADAVAKANVPLFTAQNRNYVIATGGAAGAFFCATSSGMQAFINRYASANLVGIDFDIEGGQTQADITALVKSVYDVQSSYPNLRFSFTLATLGSTNGLAGSAPNGDLSPLGGYVMNALAKYPLNNYTINLMVMDYGSPGAGVCVVGSDGLCDMGQTAIQAAKNLAVRYGVPYNHIELTPMIGMNDVTNELFSLKDAATMTQWARTNGISGIHFWSVDRDTPCTSAYASPICSSVPTVPAWGFTQEFIKDIGL
ncbi:MAG: hypothetical protein RLZ25_1009 [Pseudomonadota bacterium]|jgi:hypothetical protein